ncbi:MAG: glycosyltransferase family 2 protein [Candidatus Zixiibacteriota bacterium]
MEKPLLKNGEVLKYDSSVKRKTKNVMLSIIIISYNTKNMLRLCLDSIFRYPLTLGRFEIIIVDNASPDKSGEMVRKRYPQITLIQNHRNHGFAYASNQGIRHSKGEYFLLLNPDTRLLPDALNTMMYFLMENQDIGASGGLMMNENGTMQPSCLVYPNYFNVFFSRSSVFTKIPFVAKKARALRSLPDGITDVDAIAGGYFYLKREALNQIGLFDERFFLYVEDIDICKRLKDVGWRVVFNPESKIIHHWGASSSKMKRKTFWWHHISMFKYFQKHYRSSVLNFTTLMGLVAHYIIWVGTSFFKEIKNKSNKKKK